MNGGLTVQRRSLCTLTGMAIGFRAFYAVIVNGGQMYGSRWIALLIALLLAAPVALMLIPVRRKYSRAGGKKALNGTVWEWGERLLNLLLFIVLTYDAAATIRILCGTAKYVAMPEANLVFLEVVTAAVAALAALMGAAAIANGAVLWRRLMAALIVLLAAVQASSFRAAWLTPVLGPGLKTLAAEAMPAAGMFSFAAAGFFMMDPEHDEKGTALVKTVLKSGLVTVALGVLFCMLTPALKDELSSRSFRIGRLLANDRAGLSLEMPYVVLLYSGMLTMLLFETAAAASAARIVLPGIKAEFCTLAVVIMALAIAVSGLAERETVERISAWYYPVIAVPALLAGCAAWLRGRKEEKAA